jgi:hypothetical protein
MPHRRDSAGPVRTARLDGHRDRRLGLPWRGVHSRPDSHGTWAQHDACGIMADLRAGSIDCPACGPQPRSRTHQARQDEPYPGSSPPSPARQAWQSRRPPTARCAPHYADMRQPFDSVAGLSHSLDQGGAAGPALAPGLSLGEARPGACRSLLRAGPQIKQIHHGARRSATHAAVLPRRLVVQLTAATSRPAPAGAVCAGQRRRRDGGEAGG